MTISTVDRPYTLTFHASGHSYPLTSTEAQRLLTMTYRPIPSLPEDVAPETAYERGARALRWILETGVTVTLSDVDLSRADVAAGLAIVQAADEDMRALLSERRHAILATLRIRRALDKAATEQGAACKAEHRPNLGPMAPLQPSPIVRPPSPALAEIEF